MCCEALLVRQSKITAEAVNYPAQPLSNLPINQVILVRMTTVAVYSKRAARSGAQAKGRGLKAVSLDDDPPVESVPLENLEEAPEDDDLVEFADNEGFQDVPENPLGFPELGGQSRRRPGNASRV